MTDTLPNRNIVSNAQEYEAVRALNAFEEFQFATLVATSKQAQLLAETSISRLKKQSGIDLFLSILDFDDVESITHFLEYWGENKKIIKDLHTGFLDPREMRGGKYPVFLFINPTNLDLLSPDYNDQLDIQKAENSKGLLMNITKYGRLHVVVTPNKLEHTGSAWPNIPMAYQQAVLDPENSSLKVELSKYFMSRSGLRTLNLTQRVEDSYSIYTPTAEALDRVLKK